MSRFKNRGLKSKNNNNYYKNVLLELGLSRFYILYNNYKYFGYNDLDDQKSIKEKFKIIEKDFSKFLIFLYKKYDRETLIIEFGTIFTKLRDIYIRNSDVLLGLKDSYDVKLINNISYPAKVADLMSRKIKTITEIVIIKDNRVFDFGLCNRNYKRFVILLYYYSLYIFYLSRSNLSKEKENSAVNFYIFPNDLNPINTGNIDLKNSHNLNKTQFNYNSGIEKNIDVEFNNSFSLEKGISYVHHNCLLQSMVNNMITTNRICAKIGKNKLLSFIKENYGEVCVEKFEIECILNKCSFELSEKEIYKNDCKHRLDTVSLIDVGMDYYILIRGFLSNTINFWNNVHSIGMIPYNFVNGEEDNIIIASNKIIQKVTHLLEDDIEKILLRINCKMIIKRNRKSKHIFKNINVGNNEWDIIAIDKDKKIIFDIESKFLSTSMTESGLAFDLDKLTTYVQKFEKRIKIEQDNIDKFLEFCCADDSFNIVRIMVTSKVVDFNLVSPSRNFCIVHYDGLYNYIIDNFYH